MECGIPYVGKTPAIHDTSHVIDDVFREHLCRDLPGNKRKLFDESVSKFAWQLHRRSRFGRMTVERLPGKKSSFAQSAVPTGFLFFMWGGGGVLIMISLNSMQQYGKKLNSIFAHEK